MKMREIVMEFINNEDRSVTPLELFNSILKRLKDNNLTPTPESNLDYRKFLIKLGKDRPDKYTGKKMGILDKWFLESFCTPSLEPITDLNWSFKDNNDETEDSQLLHNRSR